MKKIIIVGKVYINGIFYNKAYYATVSNDILINSLLNGDKIIRKIFESEFNKSIHYLLKKDNIDLKNKNVTTEINDNFKILNGSTPTYPDDIEEYKFSELKRKEFTE